MAAVCSGRTASRWSHMYTGNRQPDAATGRRLEPTLTVSGVPAHSALARCLMGIDEWDSAPYAISWLGVQSGVVLSQPCDALALALVEHHAFAQRLVREAVVRLRELADLDHSLEGACVEWRQASLHATTSLQGANMSEAVASAATRVLSVCLWDDFAAFADDIARDRAALTAAVDRRKAAFHELTDAFDRVRERLRDIETAGVPQTATDSPPGSVNGDNASAEGTDHMTSAPAANDEDAGSERIGPRPSESGDGVAGVLLAKLRRGELPSPPSQQWPAAVAACVAASSGPAIVLNSALTTFGATGADGRASKLLVWLLAQLPASDYSVYTGRNAGDRNGSKHRWWVLGTSAREALIAAAQQTSLAAFNTHARVQEYSSIAAAAQKRLRERGFDTCPTCRSSLALREGAEDSDVPRPAATCELCHRGSRPCSEATAESGGG